MQFALAQQVSGIKTTHTHTYTHGTLNTNCELISEPLLPSVPLSVSCIPEEAGQQSDTAMKEEFTSVTGARHSPVPVTP